MPPPSFLRNRDGLLALSLRQNAQRNTPDRLGLKLRDEFAHPLLRVDAAEGVQYHGGYHAR